MGISGGDSGFRALLRGKSGAISALAARRPQIGVSGRRIVQPKRAPSEALSGEAEENCS